jgi:hypothetical protein
MQVLALLEFLECKKLITLDKIDKSWYLFKEYLQKAVDVVRKLEGVLLQSVFREMVRAPRKILEKPLELCFKVSHDAFTNCVKTIEIVVD